MLSELRQCSGTRRRAWIQGTTEGAMVPLDSVLGGKVHGMSMDMRPRGQCSRGVTRHLGLSRCFWGSESENSL